MKSRRLFVGLYFLSGVAALMYEVAWSRLLELSMGHTVAAIGTVLAAFMGGLAFGARVGGRFSRTFDDRTALRTYAYLELTIAASALLIPFALSGAFPLLAWAYQHGAGGYLFGITRLTLSLVLLGIPTAAMGATYPVAVRWLRVRSQTAEASAGALYAANTLGAAAGAALSGFVLLPTVGLRATTLTGVALNVAVAAGVFWLAAGGWAAPASPAEGSSAGHSLRAGRHRPARGRQGRQPGEAGDRWVTSSRQVGMAAVAVGISGAVALAYEVSWTRMLALVLGPTSYAFGAMLVVFIAGLALGSFVATVALPRIQRPGFWLGIAISAAAIAAFLVSWRFDHLPFAVATAIVQPGAQVGAILRLEAGLISVRLLPLAAALGAAFPLAVAAATRGADADDVTLRVAKVYAANTIGAIVGALAGSFLLIPAVGLEGTVRIVGILGIGTGLTVAWLNATGGRLRAVAVATAAVGLGLALSMPPWNHARLSSGAYKYAESLDTTDLQSALEAGRLLYYRDGAAGTISVKEVAGVTSLAIDGKVDASNGADMLTQKLLAHLPMMLHPRPQTVCILGLGSGVTVGAALRHPVERVDVLEISPEVVAASEHFAAENHEALKDPRTRVVVGDGRSHLLLSGDRWDVIISEPSNPWLAGVAALFTREFLEGARQHLAPGGILCQWAHTYQMTPQDLRSIVRTFVSVFPEGTAWLVGEGDLLLIGSTGPLKALDTGLASAFAGPGVAADLAEVSVHDPFSLLTLFVARGADLRQYAADAVVQSDDRLALGDSAPLAIYGRFQEANVATLGELARQADRPPAVSAAVTAATAEQWRHRGDMELKASAFALAYDAFAQASAKDPSDTAALDGLVRAAVGAGRLPAATALLRNLAAATRSVPAMVALSRLLAGQGQLAEALQAAKQAAVLESDSVSVLEQLSAVLADQGDVEGSERAVTALEKSAATRPVTLYHRARLEYVQGRFARAADLLERSAAIDRSNPMVFNLLGGAWESLGDNDRARHAFEASLRVNPRDPAVLLNLGTIALRAADPVAAAERFAEALYLSPGLKPALRGLADALNQQGQTERAETIRKHLPAS